VISRFVKDTVLSGVCSQLPHSFIVWLRDVNPVSAYYHIVSDIQVPHVKHLYKYRDVASFERDLDAFSRRFNFVSAGEVLCAIRQHRPLPGNSLLLTFDDGFSEMYNVVLPILLRKGIPATFFLISGSLDNGALPLHNKMSVLLEHLSTAFGTLEESALVALLARHVVPAPDFRSGLFSITYPRRHIVDEVAKHIGCDFDCYLARQKPFLTSEQVRAMIKHGFSFGGHSVDHPMYSLIELREQVRQTCESVAFVRERFGLDYGVFAFPHGDDKVSPEYFRAVADTGKLDVSFGTRGMVKEGPVGHLQRFSMENTLERVDRILGWYYARALFKRTAA